MSRPPIPYWVQAVDRGDINSNAVHSWFRIRVRRDREFALPILGQEIREEDFLTVRHRLAALVPSCVMGWGAYNETLATQGTWGAAIIAVLATILGWVVIASVVVRLFLRGELREMEIRGKSVEAAWASMYIRAGLTGNVKGMEGMTVDGYWLAEALSLTTYKQFKGVPLEEIAARMLEYRPTAEKWVRDNFASIFSRHASKFPNDLGVRSGVWRDYLDD